MWYRGRATRLAVVFNQDGTWDPLAPGHAVNIHDHDEDFDDRYTSAADLMNGVQQGRLLVHARRPDNEDFSYGI